MKIVGTQLSQLKSHKLAFNIDRLLTPAEILNNANLEKAEPINPARYLNFNQLWLHRKRIQQLQLLPVKTDEMREKYRLQSKVNLQIEIEHDLESHHVMMASNRFPYFLPADVEQHLIWFSPSIPREHTAWWVARFLEYTDRDICDIIIFERSTVTTTELVRGTFPAIRHVHLWLSKY